MEQELQSLVRELNRCNQRGGRMLSLVDLLEAETVDLAMGGYLAAAMRAGASLMVGANPGGAGKTTVMAALLNWLPNRTRIRAAESYEMLRLAAESPPEDPSACCYVAHEIGSGHYYAYVWGREARAFFSLTRHGYIIATNLHADTLGQAHRQVVGTNGVAEEDLSRVQLKVFMRMERRRGWQVSRTIHQVYESAGGGDRLLWSGNGRGDYRRQADSALVSREEEGRHQDLLDKMRRDNVRFIEDVRRLLLAQG